MIDRILALRAQCAPCADWWETHGLDLLDRLWAEAEQSGRPGSKFRHEPYLRAVRAMNERHAAAHV